MAWNTATVALGETTKKSHYDRLRANDQAIASGTFTFYGAKTFAGAVGLSGGVTGTCTHRGKTTFSATAVFKNQRRNSNNEILYNWHKVTNPSTGWITSKTSGWTADSFSGGLLATFTPTTGTVAVIVYIEIVTALGDLYTRKYNDTNVSNTPIASQEYSHKLTRDSGGDFFIIWLSSDYKAEFAVSNVLQDVYISYPIAELR